MCSCVIRTASSTGCRENDHHFIYAEWDNAATRIRTFLEARAEGCDGSVVVEQRTMPKNEYDALLPDDAEEVPGMSQE